MVKYFVFLNCNKLPESYEKMWKSTKINVHVFNIKIGNIFYINKYNYVPC